MTILERTKKTTRRIGRVVELIESTFHMVKNTNRSLALIETRLKENAEGRPMFAALWIGPERDVWFGVGNVLTSDADKALRMDSVIALKTEVCAYLRTAPAVDWRGFVAVNLSTHTHTGLLTRNPNGPTEDRQRPLFGEEENAPPPTAERSYIVRSHDKKLFCALSENGNRWWTADLQHGELVMSETAEEARMLIPEKFACEVWEVMDSDSQGDLIELVRRVPDAD